MGAALVEKVAVWSCLGPKADTGQQVLFLGGLKLSDSHPLQRLTLGKASP